MKTKFHPVKTEMWVNNDINLSSEQMTKILELFGNYFKFVKQYKKPINTLTELLDFIEPNPIIDKGNPVVILNLDKNLEMNNFHRISANSVVCKVDVSRQYNIHCEYTSHRVEIPTGRFGLGRHTNRQFFIYDSDVVVGHGVKLVKERILANEPDATISIVSPVKLLPHQELIDLSDLVNKGVRLENTQERIPYLTNEKFLEKFCSIPKEFYMDFKNQFDRIVNPSKYELEDRIDAIYKWAIATNRKSFVIGISGGIDSAVSLGLLSKMIRKYPSEGFQIFPVIAPISNSMGTTGQEEATELAIKVCKHFRLEPTIIGLGSIAHAKNQHLCGFSDKYLMQQTDYWLRPMAFQYVAEKQEAVNSCIVGTVNYSEWITGWMSQKLDLFNLNPIVDLWKSQVYKLAELLKVPLAVIDVPPMGGLASGKTDEQELGFTYDELEAYHTQKYTLLKSQSNLIEQRYLESSYKREQYSKDYIFAIQKLIESNQ